MTRRKKSSLPVPGEVFLMPLDDGRFGVCRVLRKGNTGFWRKSVLAVATPWIGSRAPELSEPLLRQVLALNHHAWRNEPAALWISSPIPSTFISLGFLEPDMAEEQMNCNSGGAWVMLSISVLDQWRWDNDRETLLQEESQQKQEESRRREAANQQHGEYLSRVTLAELRNKQRFSNWEGCVSKAALQATRSIFYDTIDNLIALGQAASETMVLDILKKCIESLNALDVQHGGFIETIAREDLCEEFEEIVCASGLGYYNDLADRWREW